MGRTAQRMRSTRRRAHLVVVVFRRFSGCRAAIPHGAHAIVTAAPPRRGAAGAAPAARLLLRALRFVLRAHTAPATNKLQKPLCADVSI